MYIWRKRMTTNWVGFRKDEFRLRFGGSLAIIERPETECVTLEVSCATESAAHQLIREFGGSVEKLRPGWLQHFSKQTEGKPLRIGSRLIILSTPARRATAERAVIIPAGTAFGTGHHATTALCLRLLERITRRFHPGWRMLDAGTGSGILAIAGSCFGAGRVVAIDNDPLACATAKRNARVNGARNIEFSTGDVLKRKLSGKFEIITANLFSEIVIEALPIWSRHLAANGHLILSGILRSQEITVVRALRRHSFVASEIRRRGKWIALLAQPRRQKGS
jgi:ribosomal protein L11 methyltransferase